MNIFHMTSHVLTNLVFIETETDYVNWVRDWKKTIHGLETIIVTQKNQIRFESGEMRNIKDYERHHEMIGLAIRPSDRRGIDKCLDRSLKTISVCQGLGAMYGQLARAMYEARVEAKRRLHAGQYINTFEKKNSRNVAEESLASV